MNERTNDIITDVLDKGFETLLFRDSFICLFAWTMDIVFFLFTISIISLD